MERSIVHQPLRASAINGASTAVGPAALRGANCAAPACSGAQVSATPDLRSWNGLDYLLRLACILRSVLPLMRAIVSGHSHFSVARDQISQWPRTINKDSRQTHDSDKLMHTLQAFDRFRALHSCFAVNAAMQSLASRSSHSRLTACSRQHHGCMRQISIAQHRCCNGQSGHKAGQALRFKQQGGYGNCRKGGAPTAMALPTIVPSTASQPFGIWAALALAGAAGTAAAQLPDVPLCQQ